MPAGRRFLVFNIGGTTTNNGNSNYSATEIFIKELLLSNNVNGIMTRYFPGGNLLTHMVTPLAIPQVPPGTVVTFSMVNKDVFGDIVLKQLPDVKIQLKLSKSLPDEIYAFPDTSVSTTTTRPVGTTATAAVNGAISSTTALVVDGNNGTIFVGDRVTGAGMGEDVTVLSLTDQNSLVLSSAQSISNDVDLTFSAVTTSATYDVVTSYAEHEPVSASNKYIVNFNKTFTSIAGSADASKFILNELKEVSSDDFKYEKTTLSYPGNDIDLTSSKVIQFKTPITTTASVKANGHAGGSAIITVNTISGPITVGDGVTGTGIAVGTTVSSIVVNSLTEYVITLSAVQTNVADATVITFTYLATLTNIPDSIYVGSSVDWNLYNSSGGISASHSNKVHSITRDDTNSTIEFTTNPGHIIPSNTVFLFNKTTPSDWDFDIKNSNGTITNNSSGADVSPNTYLLSTDIEISRYGLSDAILELNLDKLISYRTVAAPDVVKVISNNKLIIKGILSNASTPQNKVVLLTGHNRIISSNADIKTYRGTGYVIANVGDNVLIEGQNIISGNNMISISGVGNGNVIEDSVEIFSLTAHDGSESWDVNGSGYYQGRNPSKIGFQWSAQVADNVTGGSPLNITLTVAKQKLN